MGLDANGTRCLLHAKSIGVNFARTAMIGRQKLHLSDLTLSENLADYGFHVARHLIRKWFLDGDGYAEPFLRFLGASTIESFDCSSYEGATHLHNMNAPIPDALRKRYTTVIDSGSLEHIFNVPVALANFMDMIEVGGHFIGITPANNLFGHGFYQFSPEFFFRTFSSASGYRVICMFVFENRGHSPWYAVSDPNALQCRVTLVNHDPVYLCVVAQRTEYKPLLADFPMQSDYCRTWKDAEKTVKHDTRTLTIGDRASLLIGAVVPTALRSPLRHMMEIVVRHVVSPFRTKAFRKMPRRYR